MVEQTFETSVIWDVIVLIMTSLQCNEWAIPVENIADSSWEKWDETLVKAYTEFAPGFCACLGYNNCIIDYQLSNVMDST